MEASTESWGACPGCHSCPQLLKETCCALLVPRFQQQETLTVWSLGRPRPGDIEISEAAGPLDTCHAHFFTSPSLGFTPHPPLALGDLSRPLPTEKSATPKLVPNAPLETQGERVKTLKHIQAEHSKKTQE